MYKDEDLKRAQELGLPTSGYVESVSHPAVPADAPLESLAAQAIFAQGGAILTPYEGERRWEIDHAIVRLTENLRRLDWRRNEHAAVCEVIVSYEPNTPIPVSLSDLQLMLFDKVEAFHQHIYATLSTLSRAVNMMRDRSAPQYPIGSNTSFLNALQERDSRFATRYLTDIEQLQKSIDYRSKWVDHLDRSPLYDWYTTSPPGVRRKYVVLFKRKAPGPVTVRFEPFSRLNPHHPEYRPPMDCADFVIIPDVDVTYEALQRVVIAALRLDEQPSAAGPADPATAPPT